MSFRRRHFPPPLRLWLPGSLLLIGIALQLVALNVELRRGRSLALDSTTQYARLVGTLITSQLDAAYRMQLTQGPSLLMGLLASDPKVDLAAVIGPSDRILSATEVALQGKSVASSPFAGHAELLKNARETNSGQTRTVGDSVLGAFPVLLLSAQRDARNLQILVVATEHRMADALAAARKEAIARALLQGAAVLLVCLMLYLLVDKLALSRLAQLVTTTQKLAAGDYGARSRLGGSDEIFEMAKAFDHMAKVIQERDQEVQSAAQRLSRLLGNLDDAVFVCGESGDISIASGSVSEIFGVQSSDLEATNLLDHFDRAEASSLRQALKSAKTAIGQRIMVEVSREMPDSEPEQHLEVIVGWPEDPELVGGCIVNIREVTERRRLEDKLLATQKLELVGQLAGGVAHDFNNLLSVIMVNGENVLAAEAATWPHRENLEQIVATAVRGGSLTRQLLTMGRRNVLGVDILDLCQVSRDLEPLLRGLLPENIGFQMALSKTPCWVRGNVGLLEQIIVNLVVNARDAMPDGGTVVLGVEGQDRGQVCLSLVDTGCGIPDAQLAKVFDPFFTTKPLGVGTGLGLSTVQDIVRDLEGTIEVESATGEGTRFEIRLAESEQPTEATVTPTPPRLAGSECVLYVEDDDQIREGLAQALGDYGYIVHAYATAELALESWPDIAASVDVLATDLMLPGLNGYELALTIRARRPDLPVLFVSGYTDAAEVRARIVREGEPLLQKPFSSAALMGELRRLIDDTKRISSSVAAASAQTRATILVAEDLDILRRLMTTVLSSVGYEVLTAADGDEAFKLYQSRASDIRAAIIDVGLPKLSGSELAQKIASESDMQIIMSSGRDSSTVAHLIKSGVVSAFLAKPFTPTELEEAVAAALAADAVSQMGV